MLLADTTTADYWLGLDAQDRLCLVVGFPGSNAIAATSCTDADSFATEGLALQANTRDGAVVAYVLPDAAVAAQPSAALIRVAPNLLVGDPFAAAQSGVSLTGAAATSSGVQLPQFGAPEPF